MIVEGVSLRGVVCAVPGTPQSVEQLGADVFSPEELEKISKSVGLKQLYRVADSQTAGDLCVAAARRLLQRVEWAPESIDGVLMVTQSPDCFLPATSCLVHGQLGLGPHCLAFDIGMGCSGYVYGLLVAGQMIASGACKRVLLLAGDTISPTLDPNDKSTAVLFGDAGSATALEAQPAAARMSFVLGTDGSGAHNLIIRGGGFRNRHTARPQAGGVEREADTLPHLFMDGLAVFDFALQRVPQLVSETISLHGWQPAEVDYFLFHQANAFMLHTVAKRLRIPAERMPINIGKYGNTSMASIPLLMADDLSTRLCAPEVVNTVLAGFGVGFSWAAAATSLGGLRVAEVVCLPEKERCCTTPSI